MDELLQQAQHVKLYSDLLQAQKEGTFDSPGLLPGGGGGQAPVDEVTDLDELLQQAQHVKLYSDPRNTWASNRGWVGRGAGGTAKVVRTC